MKKTLLVDGQWNLKRNYYPPHRKILKGANGKLCGGTFGFLDSTRSILNKLMPDRVVVAWDGFHAGKMRYNMLGNGGHWFPGNKAEKVQELDLSTCLKDSPHAEAIPIALAEAHDLLSGEESKRLQES